MRIPDLNIRGIFGWLRERFRAFRTWQETPPAVAPLSTEHHVCATCATHFQGQFCPRCGQPEQIGRYSFKSTILLFIDVWGLGNRGMFRSLRDLILRPGYMIRDYLSGMQRAYFPPFKMIFLFTTFSLLLDWGLDAAGIAESHVRRQHERVEMFENRPVDDAADEEDHNVVKATNLAMRYLLLSQYEYPNASKLFYISVVTMVAYLFFRRSRNIPDMRFSEFMIAMVYSVNMMAIYSILFRILEPLISTDLDGVQFLLIIIPMKQLTGFSWLGTAARILVSVILVFILMIVALGVFLYAVMELHLVD